MEAKLPPFAMIEFYFGDSDAALTVMSRGKRFSISITTEDLRGTHGDELVQTFLDYKKNMDDDPYVMEEFQEWMVKPCVFYMDQFKSSTPRVEPPSLEEYFAPDTAIIKLTNAEGSLKATMCPGNPLDTQSFTPRIAMSDPTVQEAISRGLPLTPAAQLKAVLGPEAYEADYDLIPTTVQVIGKETQFHFKGAFEKQSFRRELDIPSLITCEFQDWAGLCYTTMGFLFSVCSLNISMIAKRWMRPWKSLRRRNARNGCSN
jgi:hypothetical protein